MITSRNLSSKTVGPDWQSSTALKKTSFQGSKDKNSIKIFKKKKTIKSRCSGGKVTKSEMPGHVR